MMQGIANLDDADQLPEPGHTPDGLGDLFLPGHFGEHREQHPSLGQELLAGEGTEAFDKPVDPLGVDVTHGILITSVNHLMKGVELVADLSLSQELLTRRAEKNRESEGQAAAMLGGWRGTVRHIALNVDLIRVDQGS